MCLSIDLDNLPADWADHVAEIVLCEAAAGGYVREWPEEGTPESR